MNVKSFDGARSYYITEEQYKTFQAKCSCARDLNLHVMDFTEEQLLIAMDIEKENRNRVNILVRLYSRYSTLRKEREKKELLK